MEYYFEVFLAGVGSTILVKAKDVIEAGRTVQSYYEELIEVRNIEISEIHRTNITKVIE